MLTTCMNKFQKDAKFSNSVSGKTKSFKKYQACLPFYLQEMRSLHTVKLTNIRKLVYSVILCQLDDKTQHDCYEFLSFIVWP